MTRTPTLPETLREALAREPAGALAVAFSGGPDSTALLHALASLPAARARGLRALHVDHALHAQSAIWAAQCQAVCHELELACVVRTVTVAASGEGIEAAARHARYRALGEELQPGEWLLLAQHREDQAETVLLKLLRGAGPQGLGGMRAQRPLGPGRLWRPLLDTPRARLHDYLDRHALSYISDPSNADLRLSRNYLRADVLPVLGAHWPQAIDSILHSAARLREAAETLEIRWLEAFERLHDATNDTLKAAAWLALEPALRQPLLDHWLHRHKLPVPGTAQRRQIERQISAAAGRVPCVRWGTVTLHIWKGRLWLQPVHAPVDPCWEQSWHGETVRLPDGGVLRAQAPAPIDPPLTLRLRRGGERLRPVGDRHTRELRYLFQQGQLPPWQRAACPLIHDGCELIAVADRWCSHAGQQRLAERGIRVRWTPGYWP